jgi:hypothetical protein
MKQFTRYFMISMLLIPLAAHAMEDVEKKAPRTYAEVIAERARAAGLGVARPVTEPAKAEAVQKEAKVTTATAPLATHIAMRARQAQARPTPQTVVVCKGGKCKRVTRTGRHARKEWRLKTAQEKQEAAAKVKAQK